MTMTQVTFAAWLALLLLPLMMVGCQWGIGARVSPAPHPPLPPTPAASDQKVIDGYLHVRYSSCPRWPSQIDSVAPITLTDLRSGSLVFLNRNGTLKSRPKPRYESEQGKATLEAALKDADLVKQIVARPSCEEAYKATVRQRDGWPDAYAEDIGAPPIPKVGIGVTPMSATSPPVNTYPGWIGAYCWQEVGGSRECEDAATWEGFGGAEAMIAGSKARVYFTVLGYDGEPGRLRRIQMFPAQEKWSIQKLGRVLHLGEEVHSDEARGARIIERYVVPNLPGGVYLLKASYEFPEGEVEYGFKVAIGK